MKWYDSNVFMFKNKKLKQTEIKWGMGPPQSWTNRAGERLQDRKAQPWRSGNFNSALDSSRWLIFVTQLDHTATLHGAK